jgi:hypothetical protein
VAADGGFSRAHGADEDEVGGGVHGGDASGGQEGGTSVPRGMRVDHARMGARPALGRSQLSPPVRVARLCEEDAARSST